MDRDTTASRANQTRGSLLSRVVRRNSGLLTVFLGAIVGMLVGILNLSAADNRWKIQEDFFDIVDAPIHSLIAGYPSGIILRPSRSYRDFQALSVEQVVICYWAAIGFSLASLLCLVRAGVIRDIARDKICRYILFFASCGGMFIGSLSFLAASNGWEDLDNCFDSLNQPAYSVMDAISYHFDIEATAMQKGFIGWHIAAIIYWAIIGLVLALVFCVVRILKMRKAVRENPL